MTEIIEFPNNFEGFIALGKQALNDGNLVIAKENFLAAYNLQAAFEVNVHLVTVLLDLGEYQLAKKYAEEMAVDYQEDWRSLKIYLYVLQMNQEFLLAKQLLNQTQSSVSESEKAEVISLKTEIDRGEAHYRQLELKEIQELRALFQELPMQSTFTQISTIKKARKLPEEDFSAICQEHLSNEKLSQLVRGTLLETLAKLGSNEPINMLCYDGQIQTVTPSHLTKITSNNRYNEAKIVLENLLQNDDPILCQTLIEELKLVFAIIYPLTNETIYNVPLWISLYIEQYQPDLELPQDSVHTQEEINQIRRTQETIRKKIASVVIG